MQILPLKWATRDSRSTLEMAPRTPTVCKGLRSNSKTKRRTFNPHYFFYRERKKNNILRYKSPTPSLTLLLVPSCDKIQSVMLKKTRRFEVCKNLNQYVKKKKRITKVYSTKQTKIVLIF